MKVALVGFGKMGHMIAKAALARGHQVVCTVDISAEDATCVTDNLATMVEAIKASGADGVIEFSHPSSVFANISALIPTGLPVVVGTTGWHDRIEEIRSSVAAHKSALLYSSNYSLGVNLFYRMVADAARLMAEIEEYDVAVIESHHNQKADSPSGTALEIAKRILGNYPRKSSLVTDAFSRRPNPGELHVASVRVGSVPGTHTVFFDSPADSIELTHTARNREGFALGAVRALEWLVTPLKEGVRKEGLFTMDDVFADL